MQVLVDYSQYLTILGLLVTLTGVYKLHHAVKPDSAAAVTFHTKEPHDAAIIDFYEARQGLRYTVYGFLIQTVTILV